MALKAQVMTPGVEGEDLGVEEIPLPPQSMWSELDNSGDTAEAPVRQADVPAEKATAPRKSVAMLDFVGDSHLRQVPLKHPFRWEGSVVESLSVRRLTIDQLSAVLNRQDGESLTTFDLYALMIGLPAPVLRGLVDEDGEAMAEAAYDFLPRQMRPDAA